MSRIILHITKRKQWEQSKSDGKYLGDTLSSQGFIHCSTPNQIIKVANALFKGQKELVLLCIDSAKVKAEIHYESIEGNEKYPHIYGPLNIDSVIKVLDFEPDRDGKFKLSKEIQNIAVTNRNK